NTCRAPFSTRTKHVPTNTTSLTSRPSLPLLLSPHVKQLRILRSLPQQLLCLWNYSSASVNLNCSSVLILEIWSIWNRRR
ncbi:hypothetical protein BHE74_00058932, partial [Ensete ventricosum]